MPWLATAYVAGPSLTEAVRDHGPLPVRSLLALTAGLAEGLGAIHAAGVVHRDLKPSNVLLAEDGPRVIDFGISEAAEASVATGANVMIGSPGFMSPEQVLGFDIDPASDMFSLGAVLTFAATGPGTVRFRVERRGDVPAGQQPGGAWVSVPGELRSLIGSCLAKDPGDRPTACELLAEVGAIQPAPGWLAESIIASFTQEPSGRRPRVGRRGQPLALTEAPSASRAGVAGRPGRHRISRSVASVCLSGGLVAASAVAAFALIGADRTPAAGHVQPQAGAGSAATAPASASTRRPRPRRGRLGLDRASLRAAVVISRPRSRLAPSVYLTPSLSRVRRSRPWRRR